MIKFLSDRINRLIKFISVNFYLKTITDKSGITKNKDCNVYLWIPNFGWRYYINEKIIWDYGKMNALSKLGIKYKIFKGQNIGKISNKTIHLNYSDIYNWRNQFNDYTQQFHFLVKQLEAQDNIVFPSSKEIFYWENKGYMHKKFKEYNISEPKTNTCKSLTEVEKLNFKYPFLLKEEHSSGSAGIHKINSKATIDKLKKDEVFKPNETIIVQELIEMRRDLRVILVNNEIVHFYWRINNDKEWKPTSTSKGSSVDFEFFPEQWRAFIIEEFEKFKITTGAFDITWPNDDLNNKPLILEISPTYQLNPKTSDKKKLMQYGKFKNYSFFGKESYVYQYIKQTFNVIEKIVATNHNNQV